MVRSESPPACEATPALRGVRFPAAGSPVRAVLAAVDRAAVERTGGRFRPFEPEGVRRSAG